jgi:hypothetical protein
MANVGILEFGGKKIKCKPNTLDIMFIMDVTGSM